MKILTKKLIKLNEKVPVYDLTIRESNPCFELECGVISHNSDYSQAELVTLAVMSKDPGMIQAFKDGLDMHQFVASKAFDVPFDQVSKDQRRFAKVINFGLIYGKSIENLAIEMTSGDVPKAQGFVDLVMNKFPGIRKFISDKHKELDKLGYVTNFFGANLEIDLMEKGNGKYRKAQNSPIQSTSNIIAGTSIYNLSLECEKQNIPEIQIGFTHDADDSLCKVDDLFKYLEIMIWKLQREVYDTLGFPMKIDTEIGIDSYGACGISIVDKLDNKIILNLKGEEDPLNQLIDRLSKAQSYEIVFQNELKSETTKNDWSELFTTGTALKNYWGNTVTKKVIQLGILLKE